MEDNMAARNDITGDIIATKTNSESYRDNFDAIFRKPKVVEKAVVVEEVLELTPEELARQEADALRRRWWAYIEDNQPARVGGEGQCPSFEYFRDNILPTLKPNQYTKFDKV